MAAATCCSRFLQAGSGAHWHWLTSKQLLDAVAVGQITPGPLFTTATFIGYVLKGAPGAVAATIGIFLPAFVFCAIGGAVLPWLRRSRLAGAFLDGVNVASLALMAVVTWELARTALVDILTIATALACSVLLFRYRVNTGCWCWAACCGGWRWLGKREVSISTGGRAIMPAAAFQAARANSSAQRVWPAGMADPAE